MVPLTDHYNAILIARRSSKTNIGKDSSSKSSPRLQRILFLLKTQKTTTLQPVTGGNTPNIFLKRMLKFSKNYITQNLVLKRMLERFLTVPPLKKILQFQERISFFLENTKTTSLENVDGEKANLVLKRMLEGFIKDP